MGARRAEERAILLTEVAVLEFLAQVLVFFLGIAVWWKARKATRAGNTTWRRRVGLLFFLAPFIVLVGRALPLPDVTKHLFDAIEFVDRGLDKLIAALMGVAKENLAGFWLAAAKMLINAGVYGGLGVLIGWPLDRWLGPKKKDEKPDAKPVF